MYPVYLLLTDVELKDATAYAYEDSVTASAATEGK